MIRISACTMGLSSPSYAFPVSSLNLLQRVGEIPRRTDFLRGSVGNRGGKHSVVKAGILALMECSLSPRLDSTDPSQTVK